MKLNPLHTPEMLFDRTRYTGCYAEPERMTGRTTALALSLLSHAIVNPHTRVHIHDHHQTREAAVHLATRIHNMILRLGLEHMHVNIRDLTLIFERRA